MHLFVAMEADNSSWPKIIQWLKDREYYDPKTEKTYRVAVREVRIMNLAVQENVMDKLIADIVPSHYHGGKGVASIMAKLKRLLKFIWPEFKIVNIKKYGKGNVQVPQSQKEYGFWVKTFILGTLPDDKYLDEKGNLVDGI